MPNKYQVKIEDSILPHLYTFDQLIDAGLLDDVDEKIKVRLNGESTWVIARSFPFSELESEQLSRDTSDSEDEQNVETSANNRNNTVNTDRKPQFPKCPSASNISQLQQEYPPIIDVWNWGAFGLSWIWGIFNGLYWPLIIIVLNFIPYVGLIISLFICVLLGKNGNLYAWRKAKQKGCTVEQFAYIQSKWNSAGQIVLIVFMVIIVLMMFISL